MLWPEVQQSWLLPRQRPLRQTVAAAGLLAEYRGQHIAVKKVRKDTHPNVDRAAQTYYLLPVHSNIVTLYDWREDVDYVCLQEELCSLPFTALLHPPRGWPHLWDASGHAKPQCYQVLQDVVQGICHLHNNKLVLGSLPPSRIMVTDALEGRICGIENCHKIPSGRDYVDIVSTGGSRAWSSPEQDKPAGQRCSIDESSNTFLCGLVAHYMVSGGHHPFGDVGGRTEKMRKGLIELHSTLKEHNSALARNLIMAMLRQNPADRPSLTACLAHPVFWAPKRCLDFLIEFSAWLEHAAAPWQQQAVEGLASDVFRGGWDQRLDGDLLDNLETHRWYDYGSLRQLLQAIRNKVVHHRELPHVLRQTLGECPDGYWSTRMRSTTSGYQVT
ncbi:hypothetical protein WJX73_008366 [Symbiochloris irregularis]|uniref:Protein kinase domain-containing protein n=1 Tax=Symbiochloris irregularis TaxID=706552 RepID=A0AAW1P7G8_9CHLO